MLERRPFGRTGHESTRVVFGAAALASASEEEAAGAVELLVARGVNHIDTAAGYGESERLLGQVLGADRGRFFLATKTGERDATGARRSLERSLERLRVDAVDLVQLHNLVEEDEWAQAHGPGGALEALVAAREEGLVRFIGVTGHGTRIARMHRRSLERYAYDTVLLPYNPTMLADASYARDVEALLALAEERSVAVQTIKAVARRRWPGPPEPGERRRSWYEPLTDAGAIARAVAFVLSRPGLFLNATSDLRLLPAILDAASGPCVAPSAEDLAADAERLQMAALFDGGANERI